MNSMVERHRLWNVSSFAARFGQPDPRHREQRTAEEDCGGQSEGDPHEARGVRRKKRGHGTTLPRRDRADVTAASE
jgi:hypothetical protein